LESLNIKFLVFLPLTLTKERKRERKKEREEGRKKQREEGWVEGRKETHL